MLDRAVDLLQQGKRINGLARMPKLMEPFPHRSGILRVNEVKQTRQLQRCFRIVRKRILDRLRFQKKSNGLVSRCWRTRSL